MVETDREIVGRSGESISESDERQLLDTIDRWLERDVRDQVLALEHADEYPHEMVAQMRDLGLFGATVGREWGGLGLPAQTYSRIVSRISEVWMSLTGIFNSHLMMAAAVERFGTDAQKRHFLPGVASGERRGAQDAGGLRSPRARNGAAGSVSNVWLRPFRHSSYD